MKTLETDDGRVNLRAVTGPDYGRIYDHELVAAVQRIAGNGTGDTRWKVPGVLDWSTGVYNPLVDISQETTTLYASDRNVFLFLVDDLNPIEAGRLPDGSPDLYASHFAHVATPALTRLASSLPQAFINGVNDARSAPPSIPPKVPSHSRAAPSVRPARFPSFLAPATS